MLPCAAGLCTPGKHAITASTSCTLHSRALSNRVLPCCAPQGMWRVVEALLAAGVRVQPGTLAPWHPERPYRLPTDISPANFPRSHRRVWWVARRLVLAPVRTHWVGNQPMNVDGCRRGSADCRPQLKPQRASANCKPRLKSPTLAASRASPAVRVRRSLLEPHLNLAGRPMPAESQARTACWRLLAVQRKHVAAQAANSVRAARGPLSMCNS